MTLLSLWGNLMNVSFPGEISSMREPAFTSMFSGKEKRLSVLYEHCMAYQKPHRIVVGIQDKEHSRRLLLMAHLTLTQTIQTVRQSEEVAAQVSQQG